MPRIKFAMRNARHLFGRAHTTEEAAMTERLRVRVDPDKCQGHARCKALAPELFELDEYGNAHEAGDGTVPPGLEDKAWLAKSNCPEIARSEEHTSELQSRQYLVCRLLLEKKK